MTKLIINTKECLTTESIIAIQEFINDLLNGDFNVHYKTYPLKNGSLEQDIILRE